MKRCAIVAALIAISLSTAACSDADPAQDAPAPPAASESVAAGPAGTGTLSFDLVEGMTGERLTKDPNCPIGKWGDNSTGVDEKYRADVALFKQFDCYRTESELLPARGQQSIYVEFRSADTAGAYAQDESTLYPVLLAGTVVVVAGSGLDTVDMKAYLTALKDRAGIGELLG